jgi:hypothetical protein
MRFTKMQCAWLQIMTREAVAHNPQVEKERGMEETQCLSERNSPAHIHSPCIILGMWHSYLAQKSTFPIRGISRLFTLANGIALHATKLELLSPPSLSLYSSTPQIKYIIKMNPDGDL